MKPAGIQPDPYGRYQYASLPAPPATCKPRSPGKSTPSANARRKPGNIVTEPGVGYRFMAGSRGRR